MDWIIILVIYFNEVESEKIEVAPTNVIFSDPLECAKYRSSKEFKKELESSFKDMNVRYVRAFCRPFDVDSPDEKLALEDLFNKNGSVGICSVSPCIWN
jgi:hypothetical protein